MPLQTGSIADVSRSGRHMAAAWTRIGLGAMAVLVPVVMALAGAQAAHRAGATAVHTALTSVSAALTSQHERAGQWPAGLLTAGGTVVDDSGRRIATIPAGVALAYERSVDGSRAVVTLTDRGAEAVFDSARAAR